MKRTILTVLALLSLVILLTSCSGGVSQEQYNKVSNDLTAAQSQIQSLQSDKQVLTKNSAATLAYTEFLDVLMYRLGNRLGLPHALHLRQILIG
jgi:hypothetical protein